MPTEPESMSLIVTIENSRPMELDDFANSFRALADEYKRYLANEAPGAVDDNAKIYIKQIRSGSIIAELQSYAGTMLPMFDHAKSVIEFAGYLNTSYKWLLGQITEDKKPPLERRNLTNLVTIIEPIAKDSAAQINFQPVINGNPTFILNLNSTEANAAQNRANREIDFLQEPKTGRHSNVAMYWFQARNAIGTAGDRAIIESISPRDVKCTFYNEGLKSAMLLGEENPFQFAYEVDVDVETVGGRPVLYKIVAFHQRLEKPEQD